jgi:hypothetical protein
MTWDTPTEGAKLEYKFVKYSTHNQAEQALNELVAEGWQLVSYQAAGGDSAISHFLLLSRAPRRSERGFGFGR